MTHAIFSHARPVWGNDLSRKKNITLSFSAEKPAGKGGVGIKFVIISVIAWAGICAFLAFLTCNAYNHLGTGTLHLLGGILLFLIAFCVAE